MMDLNIKFTPETVIMLPFAFICDVVGLVILLCGLDDFGLADVVPMFIIFSWLIIRGKQIPSRNGGISDKIKNLFTNKYLKFLTPLLGELTPYLGGLGFFWTLTVLYNTIEV